MTKQHKTREQLERQLRIQEAIINNENSTLRAKKAAAMEKTLIQEELDRRSKKG